MSATSALRQLSQFHFPAARKGFSSGGVRCLAFSGPVKPSLHIGPVSFKKILIRALNFGS